MTDVSGGDGEDSAERRRDVLRYAALATLGVGGLAGGWFATRPDGVEDPEPATPAGSSSATPTPTPGDAEVPAVVRRYAPDCYFGALEPWFPTDPRQYTVETGDETVVDGFTALDEYTAAFAETGTPPAPTVFYNVVEAADGVDAVQYWMYSVFDQFTVNFHWHDWELVQVFVDRASGTPLLLAASAHARSVPNNEYLEPDLAGGRRPGVLAEVGSHSSASELNEVVPTFQRLAASDWSSDVTNSPLSITDRLTTPLAYGLPRGEGARLPFVMPELDGFALYDHPSLSVGREAFVDERVTVDGWRGLPTPPDGVPLREPGLVFTSSDSETAGDVTYALEPLSVVSEAVDDFTGPQLSFEFAVPGFVEDQFASHITSVGIPWEQPRFTDPLADVTDAAHRRRIDGTEPSGLSDRVVGQVRQLGSGTTGALDGVTDAAASALTGVASVSLSSLPTEVAVQLASKSPTATVTRGGAFGYLHVEPGEHRLTVNGPGVAPLSVGFVHDGGLLRAGADGDLTVVANEDAAWLRGDGQAAGIVRVRVREDYAGVVYDGRPVDDERFAVAVHRDGRYTVDVEDADGRTGAYRVEPDVLEEDGEYVVESVETGKRRLVATLRDELAALGRLAEAVAEEDEARGQFLEWLSSAERSADAAASATERGDAEAANESLRDARASLRNAADAVRDEDRDGYSDAAAAALRSRLSVVLDRVRTALATGL